MPSCIDHLNFVGEICPDCSLKVDGYGNTESQFDYCCFPDCGCDGARLCSIGKPSEDAIELNVENMWAGKDNKSDQARRSLVAALRLQRFLNEAKNDQ